ncbi:hypothetical protein COP2_025291 [Malus domestica]
MCSYGSKIQPCPHDHQLAYISSDTKILVVDRNIKLFVFISKLSSICDTSNDAVCFKYQLPGKDLNILISVTNDEDLDHMMVEYGRLYSASAKPTSSNSFFSLLTATLPLASALARPSPRASGGDAEDVNHCWSRADNHLSPESDEMGNPRDYTDDYYTQKLPYDI